MPPRDVPNYDSAEWALAYMRGRADGYRRGRFTLNHVTGAARLAIRRGASLTDLNLVLTPFGLAWDPETLRVKKDDP